VLADLLRAAREEAELYLWHPIDAATISTPNLVGIYAEDITDAMEFIGLNKAQDENYSAPLMHNSASSIVGNGFGLCKDMADIDKCLRKAVELPSRKAIIIEYTRSSLIVEAMTLKSELFFWPSAVSKPEVHFNLGHEVIPKNRSEAFYWASVSEVLTKVIMHRLMERQPTSQFFLFGESASDSTFRTVLEKVVGTLIGDSVQIVDENSLYAASRGAAYLSMRRGIHSILPPTK
jgi:hypothetical protein